eukprot:Sdes_comp17795_c0_seq2m7054
MPGSHDPSNFILPQQPFNRCMFPRSSCYPTFNPVSNPYECQIADKIFLGTSGQNIDDIFKFVGSQSKLEILENTLFYSHLSPTSPDTLGCYPFYEDDPFVIQESPHVYFAGNQSKFETKLITNSLNQNIRIICVPDFSKTFSFVLLNLKNLNCQEIVFNCDLSL